jgi:heme-degrading monooxygenase HmoA
MFARISRYEIPTDRLDEAVEAFRLTSGGLNQLDGFVHGHLLVDRESGDLVTSTFWRTRADVENSRSRAGRLRQEAVRAVDGSVQSVVEYEVVAHFAGDEDQTGTRVSSAAR